MRVLFNKFCPARVVFIGSIKPSKSNNISENGVCGFKANNAVEGVVVGGESMLTNWKN